MSALTQVIVLAPTPNEYRAINRHVGGATFKRLAATVVECGPGRINAAYRLTREAVPRLGAARGPIVVGAGTSGSLSLELAGGDVIASNSAIISDWRMEDGDNLKVAPYGSFDYKDPDGPQVKRMVIECQDPLITVFLASLGEAGYRRGRMLTSEAFVSGKERKLALGRTYGCLACDMETGVFGFVAGRLLGLPWVSFRVVADTLDHALSDYFAIERDMTDILGRRLAEALVRLDELL